MNRNAPPATPAPETGSRRAGPIATPASVDGRPATAPPAGAFVRLDGEEFYRIAGYDRMPPFLVSVPGDTDLWIFASSGGGLAAGRVDAAGSLFPYETVDKLHDGHHHTGPVTLFRVTPAGGAERRWEPFSRDAEEDYRVERNLYKNLLGNRLLFEEINHDLGLTFRYEWSACDAWGLVRTATLVNDGTASVAVVLLDGLRNILPYGAPVALYQRSSCLVDAYKRTDCDRKTRLGIFSLTSQIVDRAEAVEELRANTVWCRGLADFEVCLSIDAVAAFRRGETPAPGHRLNGQRGNYLVLSRLELPPGGRGRWQLAADTGRSHVQVAALRAHLLEGGDPETLDTALRDAGENLRRIVASADGLQLTGDARASVHHFANVLFNNMRGGVFATNHDLPAADFADFLHARNRAVAARHRETVAALPAELPVADLLAAVEHSGDPDLERLAHEYLPLYFGRRHGDPSRPWNQFAIHVRDGQGRRALRYEGNWRDVFQNWEALAMSFPRFLPGIIARFVNASTVDGFNPYRITRDGVDWETADPDDPWSYIGYWGDHQVIYLLKFLEALPRFAPGRLEALLGRSIFSYTDVPYRLKPYPEIVADPHDTIVYDTALAARIEARIGGEGSDARLLRGPGGEVHHVTLLEKLLVPALSKLSNFVPGGGIWMNTQRPEWNDANNALAGHGLSVVTLCHLRRYLDFLARLLEAQGDGTVPVSTEVVDWLGRVRSILETGRPESPSPADRRRQLDRLGTAFSDYRAAVYAGGFSGKRDLALSDAAGLCRAALPWLDESIRVNRRDDGLFHSYNLLELTADGAEARVHPLYEMLEGQVAALNSGLVAPEEALRLLDRMFDSPLYRADQGSFLLYPERELPTFLEKNVVPAEGVRAVPLLVELLAGGDRSILERDAGGVHRFHADFGNARDLAAALDRLARREAWTKAVARDRAAVLALYEQVFHHRSFTGRSGTMYGYEGLGCIYWHMVAKLLLAVQEVAIRAAADGAPPPVVAGLARGYDRVRSGLGFEKTVREFGAFPTDPYSHTPPDGGARQPGMTGQVKEEILSRFGELGVGVKAGRLQFRPRLLKPAEFLGEAGVYACYDTSGEPRSIEVPAGGLAFSVCQVPVIYELTRGEAWIRVTTDEGVSTVRAGDRLDPDESRLVFDRRGGISRIEVGVPADRLIRD